MKKNPYDVLGIGRRADSAAIKSAYRRAAKQSHPDLAATLDGVRRFREIQEAYETLKDRERRKRCDRALDRVAARNTRRSSRPRQTTAGLYRQPQSGVEPLISAPGSGPPAGDLRNGTVLEIILSPEEARAGGRFPVRVPIARQCPECGAAVPWVLFCSSCRGGGTVTSLITVDLDLPAGIQDGSRTTVTLRGAPFLHLLFRIDPLAD
jgi:DnaJ-class molecular chaperone